MKRPTTDKLYAVACHELGHAFAMHHYGQPLRQLLITPDSGDANMDLSGPQLGFTSRFNECIVVAHAGYMTEERAWIERGYTSALSGASGDMKIAKKARGHAAEQGITAWSDREAKREAERLIDKYWSRIDAAARRIEQRGGADLDQRGVIKLIGKPNKPADSMGLSHRERRLLSLREKNGYSWRSLADCRMATAVHEAAHAVCAVKLADVQPHALVVEPLKVDGITVTYGGEVQYATAAEVESAGASYDLDDGDGDEHLITAAAGRPAEIRWGLSMAHNETAVRREADRGYQGDLKAMRQYERAARLSIPAAEKKAEQCVNKWWKTIEQVASACLSKGGTLPGREVYRLAK